MATNYREPQDIPNDPLGRQALRQHTIYPIADSDKVKATMVAKSGDVRAVWTGDKRPPKRGEWYLSGSLIEAYVAPNDLTQPHYIARLVKAEVTTRWVEVEA